MTAGAPEKQAVAARAAHALVEDETEVVVRGDEAEVRGVAGARMATADGSA